jgi:hypothetical protein
MPQTPQTLAKLIRLRDLIGPDAQIYGRGLRTVLSDFFSEDGVAGIMEK